MAINWEKSIGGNLQTPSMNWLKLQLQEGRRKWIKSKSRPTPQAMASILMHLMSRRGHLRPIASTSRLGLILILKSRRRCYSRTLELLLH